MALKPTTVLELGLALGVLELLALLAGLAWLVWNAWEVVAMRNRGFGQVELMVGLIAVAVLAGLLIGAYNMGSSAKQAEWDRQKLADIAAGQQRDQDVSDAIKEKEAQRGLAAARAEDNDRKWREARRELDRTQVALGACHAPVAAPDGGSVDDLAGEPAGSGLVPGGRPPDPGIRLTWDFVGLHDAAFTGLDGEPLFEDSARYAGDAARAGTASPYGLEDALDVAAENARALSTCRREFFATRSALIAAEAAWGKGPQ